MNRESSTMRARMVFSFLSGLRSFPEAVWRSGVQGSREVHWLEAGGFEGDEQAVGTLPGSGVQRSAAAVERGRTGLIFGGGDGEDFAHRVDQQAEAAAGRFPRG